MSMMFRRTQANPDIRQSMNEAAMDETTEMPPDQSERMKTYQDGVYAQAAPIPVTGMHRRRRATRNTEHFTARMFQLMDRGLADPIQVLMEIATGHKMIEKTDHWGNPVIVRESFEKSPDHKTRALAAAELLSYTFPKRKSVEVSAGEGQAIVFSVEEDQTAVPVMPPDEVIEDMMRQRREEAAIAMKTISGNPDGV